MWSPTHVAVTVKRATSLLTKGANNTNDCFVTIALGKEKYQTSIKEKAPQNVEWNEECELLIPDQGNTAEIVLTALHRNFLGIDEFLGQVKIPLVKLDVYERPKNRWYKLEAKPGKENKKNRGELEVVVAFQVKAGSSTNLSKTERHKSSLGGLSHITQGVGGSLLSIGSLEKRKNGLKKFAKSFGSKVHITGKKKDKYSDEDSAAIGSSGYLTGHKYNDNIEPKQQKNVDPGVISEDEDEFGFDDLSQVSSTSSVCSPNLSSGIHSFKSSIDQPSGLMSNLDAVSGSPTSQTTPLNVDVDEWEAKLYGKHVDQFRAQLTQSQELSKKTTSNSNISVTESEPAVPNDTSPKFEKIPKIQSSKENSEKTKDKTKENHAKLPKKLKYFRKDANESDREINRTLSGKQKFEERIIIGGENVHNEVVESCLPHDVIQKFGGKSREELILMIVKLQKIVDDDKKKQKDLEDYLDELLLRVMETTPKILQRPYKRSSAYK